MAPFTNKIFAMWLDSYAYVSLYNDFYIFISEETGMNTQNL